MTYPYTRYASHSLSEGPSETVVFCRWPTLSGVYGFGVLTNRRTLWSQAEAKALLGRVVLYALCPGLALLVVPAVGGGGGTEKSDSGENVSA